MIAGPSLMTESFWLPGNRLFHALPADGQGRQKHPMLCYVLLAVRNTLCTVENESLTTRTPEGGR